MQIVIEISEESYKNIKEQVDKRDYPDMSTGKAIVNGIPLPKGHGRLIDSKDVGEYLTLADVPTIIEADKEQNRWQRVKLYPLKSINTNGFYQYQLLSI